MREEIKECDQWKLDGYCDKCRRREYCSKECTVRRKRMDKEMYEFVHNKLDEKTGGVVSMLGGFNNKEPW